MTRLWPQGEPIDVRLSAHNRPAHFVWQRRLHQIQQVRQSWQVDSDWWSDEGRVRRDYIAVTTTDGLLCVIYYDLLDDHWYLAKIYD